MGRRVAADYEITALEPNRRIEFQTTAGPVRPHGRFDLEPVDGGTRVTFALDAALGGIRGMLMGGMVQKTMDAEVAALSKLKTVLRSVVGRLRAVGRPTRIRDALARPLL